MADDPDHIPYSQRPEWCDVSPGEACPGGEGAVVAIQYSRSDRELLAYFNAVVAKVRGSLGGWMDGGRDGRAVGVYAACMKCCVRCDTAWLAGWMVGGREGGREGGGEEYICRKWGVCCVCAAMHKVGYSLAGWREAGGGMAGRMVRCRLMALQCWGRCGPAWLVSAGRGRGGLGGGCVLRGCKSSWSYLIYTQLHVHFVHILFIFSLHPAGACFVQCVQIIQFQVHPAVSARKAQEWLGGSGTHSPSHHAQLLLLAPCCLAQRWHI